MKDPAKKELIEGISELFENYEEAYVPGEWEAFSQKKRKDRKLFPVWMKVAAVLLLMASVLPFLLPDTAEKETLVIKPAKVSDNKSAIKAPTATDVLSPASKNPEALVHKSQKSIKIITDIKPKSVNETDKVNVVTEQKENEVYAVVPPASKNEIGPSYKEDTSRRNTVVIASNEIRGTNSDDRSKKSTLDFLKSESKNAQSATSAKKTSKNDQWDFGVEIMPTIMKSNLNVGAGLTTAYKLSEKFSISSGVSILQMESGKNLVPDIGTSADVSTLSSKELRAVNANISAIDIPLGLVYNVNKNFYASAGVSYFNVLSEKRNNTYNRTAEVVRTAFNQDGAAYNFQAVESKLEEEASPETPLKGNSYLGFFNFSIGRQQAIFNRYNVVIEPFVKIPIGKLSAQDLQLTNSGVKFKLSF